MVDALTDVAGPPDHGYNIGRRAVEAHEPVVAILLHDFEARRQKQQLELGWK